MSIEAAEKLKREWTDKYVKVRSGVPELRRFIHLTGQVKTVNMNGKALIEFNGPEDIGWYDIDPAYLIPVEKPVAEKETAEQKESQPAKKSAPPVPVASGLSPLEQARQQGTGGKALSPLEQARQQGAGGSSAPTVPAEEKKLSPLEQARQQDAAGQKAADSGKQSPQQEPEKAATETSGLSPLEQARQQDAGQEASPAKEEDASTPKASASSPAENTAGLSPLEMARQQGAYQEGKDSEEQPGPKATEDSQPETREEQPEPAEEVDPNDPLNKPLGKLDDLKIIEGVGPQIEKILKAGGLSTWKQVSEATPEQIKELLTEAGARYRLANPVSWPRQAELAADGKWKELREYQDWLDKGVPPE